MRVHHLIPIAALLLLTACQQTETPAPVDTVGEAEVAVRDAPVEPAAEQPSRFEIYATVRLTADLSHLSEQQQQMIPLLIEASSIMDDLYWLQAYGEPKPLLDSIEDPVIRRFADINYGPWDRLAADQPFIESAGPKPLGAQFYPADMSKDEFEAWEQEGKDGWYTLIKRNAAGELELLGTRRGC